MPPPTQGTWCAAREFRHWLAQPHQINLSLAGCYYWLGKSGGRLLGGEPVFCHLPTVNADAAWQFLRELVKTAAAEHHVVLWDGAGFHQPPVSAEPA